VLVVQYIIYSGIFKANAIFQCIYGKISDLYLVAKGIITQRAGIRCNDIFWYHFPCSTPNCFRHTHQTHINSEGFFSAIRMRY